MTKEQELLIALGRLAFKLTLAEDDIQKTSADRDFWRGEWDKLRFAKKGECADRNTAIQQGS